MEAFIALGHKEIPAKVVEISKEERLIRSLVENIARRYPAPMDLIREIERLRAGLHQPSNQRETGCLRHDWSAGMMALKKAGEERLLQAALVGKNSVVGRRGHFQSGHAGNAARTAESLREQSN